VSGLAREERERLAEVFREFPGIEAVYLFGSMVEGRTHAESDLDLAIVSAQDVADRKLDLLEALARAGFCEVDLVFLSEADLVLQYEAVRQNCVIYARSDFDRGELYARIVGRYLDFLPYLEAQRTAYKRRILDG